MALLDLLGRRWSLRILWELRDADGVGFRDLQQRCGGLSPSVLNTRMAELREAQLVADGDGGYVLTPLGRELGEQLVDLDAWASRWAKKLKAS
jgi:DNA-binding HxlR family transcriptional regulator